MRQLVLALVAVLLASAASAQTATQTPTSTKTPTETPTATSTSTSTVTQTPTATLGAGTCCQCGSTCTDPTAGGCGSCVAVLNAACGVASGLCEPFTPTPAVTLTPVSTWTTIPTVTSTPVPATKTPTVTPTSFGTAGPTPLSRVPQNGNLIQAIAWTTKTAVGTAFDPYVNHKYCIYAVDFDVVTTGDVIAVTFAGNVVFESSTPKFIELGNKGPCGAGPVTVTQPTGSGSFRVTLGTYLEPMPVGTLP